MKILAYRFSAFGDVAMVATVLREFLHQNSGVEVVFVSRPNFKPLFDGIPNLKFYAVDLDKVKGISKLFRLAAHLHATFQPDVVADLHNVIRTKVFKYYFRYKRIPLVIIDKGSKQKKILTQRGANHYHPLPTMHERYADVFRKLGFSLTLSHQLPENSREKKGIGFAPFAQHQGKVLPMEKSFALTKELAKYDKVYLFGGRGEEEQTLLEWAEKIPNTVCTAGQYSLVEELELIAQLRVMISMDSANMHLASWVGTRCISIWGATHHYAGFLGYGQRKTDIVECKTLDCRPCSVFGNKPCKRKDYACLMNIEIDEVLEKLEK
ncbi:glycosyltransferase family 9 protein [Bergeyella zoohelcum]|uniref:Lipopolysaccharide heptosyltransferase II n=1 Tax=Bergeyella zoohelcum TaxID=1015 RepID=A0A376BZI1_9FLAO|nr:glycosyltransferase family 9 protein [Bergeyella zoohelcum]EKB60845.1 hypothetical protein HMPREF9700_00340 [Bergeyella zoohelcum CCUG 30536]SSZ47063.1 lipopolysaccharide heptosyltransferase II [Bergeyella zoohelcum]